MLSKGGIKILDDADSYVKVLEQRMEVLPTPPTREPQDSHEIQVTSEQLPPDIENDLSKLKVKHVVLRMLEQVSSEYNRMYFDTKAQYARNMIIPSPDVTRAVNFFQL